MGPVRSNRERVEREAEGDVAAEQLRRVSAVTEAALAHLPLDALLDTLLERIRETLETDTAAVLLLDAVTQELVARAAKGLEEEVEHGTRIPLGEGFAGRVAAERRAIFLPEVARGGVLDPILIQRGVRSMLGVPLVYEGAVLGVVHVGTLTPREFTDSECELLQLAADRMALAIEHSRLYESERAARAAAERTAERLSKLQSVVDVALGRSSLDEGLLAGLLERVREVLSVDTAAILLLDAEGRELVARAAKGLEEEVERGVRIPLGRGFAGRIAAERRPVILPNVNHANVLNPLLREKGIYSMVGVPLLVEDRVLGVVHAGSLTPRDFTPEEVSLLELAADRIAIAIDRSRQHSVASVLQRSLLPARLPEVPGLVASARYLPGADDAHVGGDWYDVIPLPGGRVGLVMGDVVSHGARAAATMGQLRTALRAYAIDGDPPGSVLERLDHLARAGREGDMATIAYVVLEPSTGEASYVLAGHPPPLVIDAAGQGSHFLEGVRTGPIGVSRRTRFVDASARIEPGDTLLLYTDGLIERRGLTLDDGLARLVEVATGSPLTPDDLCQHLVDELGRAADDVAVLAVGLSATAGERFELRVKATPEALSFMRGALGEWLVGAGAGDDDAYDIVLAVGEAGANAVEHAYGPGDEEFELTAEALGDEVRVSVGDRGRWRPSRGKNRGRGMSLMQATMDDVEVQTGEDGTIVVMRRALRRQETA